MKRIICMCGVLLLLASCENRDNIDESRSLEFKGIWTIEQVYANDHWGGPLYWRSADFEKQIRFTSNEYYEKKHDDFYLVGTYKIISATQIEITLIEPITTEYPQLKYELDSEGHLTLFKNQYEGIVGEKYNLTEKYK